MTTHRGRQGAALLLSLLALPLLTRVVFDEGVLRFVWRLKEGLPLFERREPPLQQKLYDCGPAALAEALRRRGIRVRSDDIETLAGTSVRGTTMLGLHRAATALGVPTAGMLLGFDDLQRTALPAIAFVRGNHFVVVTGVDRDAITLIDPAIGPLLLGRSQFLRQWQGETLVFLEAGVTRSTRR